MGLIRKYNRQKYNRMALYGLLALALLFLATQSASAESFGDQSKWGLQVGRLQNGSSGDYGVLFGVRHAGYFPSTPAYLGYEFQTGTDRGGSLGQDSLTYGGLLAGFDGAYFHSVAYDFSVLLGYGYGNVGSIAYSGQSLVIEPTISLGLIMLAGYRASFSAGYIYMPAANTFSTFIFGIRLDRKTFASPVSGSPD